MVPGRVSEGAHAARGSPDGHGLQLQRRAHQRSHKTSALKLYIVDPGGVNIIDKRDKTAAIPIPKEAFQEVLEQQIVGVSTRPISKTFNDDIVENGRLARFFQP